MWYRFGVVGFGLRDFGIAGFTVAGFEWLRGMACAIAGFGAAEFRVWRLAWFGALRGLGFVWFRVPQIAGLWGFPVSGCKL